MIGIAATDRIVEHAIALWRGEVDRVVAWLVAMGCHETQRTTHVNEDDGRTVTDYVAVVGVSGITVGLMPADPIATCASIGFALLGNLWSVVAPDVLARAAKRWDAERGVCE